MSETWNTMARHGRMESTIRDGSPGLTYFKWHAYDRTTRGDEPLELPKPGFTAPLPQDLPPKAVKAKVWLLQSVARTMSEMIRGQGARGADYLSWYGRYVDALNDLHAQDGLDAGDGARLRSLTRVEATTTWRLLSGYSSNPALEGGLSLHPLLGFPLIPGSSVKGLVHHAAEMDLLAGEKRTEWAADFLRQEGRGEHPRAPESALEELTDAAEAVFDTFGSLCVGRSKAGRSREHWRRREAPAPAAADHEERLPPGTLLEAWATHREAQVPAELRARVRHLLKEHTGGRALFYDAVPVPGPHQIEKPMLLDILNPHYPDFYDKQGRDQPPSDDQDPRPVYFLTVGPGVRFLFPFRIERRGRDTEQRLVCAQQVRTWLLDALENEGAGAKTAAGYGYFRVGGEGAGDRADGAPED